jgi:uncharacterized protein
MTLLNAPGCQADWLVNDSLRPITDGELAPFYEAAAQSTLAMPFCGTCESVAMELDQTACDMCADQSIVWRHVELHGTVHTATTVHRLEPGLVLTTQPYHVVDVELASGHRLLMTTTTETADAPPIGSAVVIGFRSVGGVAVPAVVATAVVVPAVVPTADISNGDIR